MSQNRPERPAGGAQDNNREEMDQLDHIDNLVSLLVDDVISDTQMRELSDLLRTNRAARLRYIDGIQLHVDLRDYFAKEKAPLPLPFPSGPGLLGPEAPGIVLPGSSLGIDTQ